MHVTVSREINSFVNGAAENAPKPRNDWPRSSKGEFKKAMLGKITTYNFEALCGSLSRDHVVFRDYKQRDAFV